jgi:hypothetical protein
VGEYLSEDLLLTLPHRQFVWTIPKVLRVFLRHDRELFADLGRLTFDILRRFFCQAAGRSLRCAMNPDFARKILAWQHSGFSIESGTRILDQPTREALCQYLVRAPLSLKRISWDEQQDVVTWCASPSGFFKGRTRRYSSLDFIAQVTLHITPRGKHLVRRYGLYSSRGRGTWKNRPALYSRAPANWYGRNASAGSAACDTSKDLEVDVLSRRKAWARLLAKVHELDVMTCPRCGSRMAVIAVITDPAQIRKIIACLDRHGRGPPPLD